MTRCRLFHGVAQNLVGVGDASVQLVVTSPPYPMIAMWDDCFEDQDREVRARLDAADGPGAFEVMHRSLDPAWREIERVLEPGGLACVNIGDATRSLGGDFALYPNHTRIQSAFLRLGFTCLPAILWRKPTNSPTKFMGSGMLPAGAYVTLEHEYILVFRKGGKRIFRSAQDKQRRRESAFFWEERNRWFSDVWLDLVGARQALMDGRSRVRSGAFPFELAWRLILMFSLQGDWVLDPFLGTGTTALAALATGRNCIGLERDAGLLEAARAAPSWDFVLTAAACVDERLEQHRAFVREWSGQPGRKPMQYTNRVYGFPVMTRQEREICLPVLEAVEDASAGDLAGRYRLPVGVEA